MARADRDEGRPCPRQQGLDLIGPGLVPARKDGVVQLRRFRLGLLSDQDVQPVNVSGRPGGHHPVQHDVSLIKLLEARAQHGQLGVFRHIGDETELLDRGLETLDRFARGGGAGVQDLVPAVVGHIAGLIDRGERQLQAGQPGPQRVQLGRAGADGAGGGVQVGHLLSGQQAGQGAVRGNALRLHEGDHPRLIVKVGDLEPIFVGAGEGLVHAGRAPRCFRLQRMDRAEQIKGRILILHHP
ncbi:hypothetical protein D3C72_1472730 [compost metagenome]